MWTSFPNGWFVTTSTTWEYERGGRVFERNYLVFDSLRMIVGTYPATDIGWVDALVHAARGEAL